VITAEPKCAVETFFKAIQTSSGITDAESNVMGAVFRTASLGAYSCS